MKLESKDEQKSESDEKDSDGPFEQVLSNVIK